MTQLHEPASTDSPPTPAAADPALACSRAILLDLFGPVAQRPFAVQFWNGARDDPSPATPHEEGQGERSFTLILRWPGALRRMLLPPSELALAEAYLRDDFDLEGSVEAAVGMADLVAARLNTPSVALRVGRALLTLPARDGDRDPARAQPDHARGAAQLAGERHSRRRDADAIRYHYNVGNEFYALWLDTRMVYSCGYFPTGAESLDAAQTAKLEHICRKLRLKPGERLLDIGCGWGGLVCYAAERYGVDALGVTLSQPQAELARQRIAAAGLGDRCRVEVRDYRDLDPAEPFDKVVSVGMFEHVGRAQLPTYYATALRLTRPGGLFLNHGIASAPPQPAGKGAWLMRRIWRPGRFIGRYVFPDGELIPPGDAIQLAEAQGWETRDVENLREHYTLTLRHWVRRLEERREQAIALVGEPTYRVWRLYMSGSARSFATNGNQLIQALYSRPAPGGACELPPTRADLYA